MKWKPYITRDDGDTNSKFVRNCTSFVQAFPITWAEQPTQLTKQKLPNQLHLPIIPIRQTTPEFPQCRPNPHKLIIRNKAARWISTVQQWGHLAWSGRGRKWVKVWLINLSKLYGACTKCAWVGTGHTTGPLPRPPKIRVSVAGNTTRCSRVKESV